MSLYIGYERYVGRTQPFSEAFVAAEKESSVLNDRPSQGKAELVSLELGNGLVGIIKEVLCIQIVITMKLKD